MVSRKIRGESILVPIASTMEALDSIISLNETAEFIRTKAGQGMNSKSICRELMNEFDVDQETAESDVTAVLTELEHLGAIKTGDPK